jgi:hypothetical protein
MTDAAFDPAAIAADAVALAELDGATGRERVPIDWLLRRLREAPASRSVDGASNLVWMFWLIAERESTRLPHGPARPSSGARPISPNSTDRTPRWLASRSRQACGCRWSAWTAGQPARCASPIPWSLRSAGRPETAADGPADTNAAPAAGIPAIALGCCEGENMQAPAERIRAGSIVTGARQLRAVLQEVLELAPRAARN